MTKYFQRALVLLVVIGAFLLRIWKLDQLMYFIDDFGWYFISARDFIINGKVPLLGIPSSIPYISQGAAWTWLLAFFLKIGHFDPLFVGFGVVFINSASLLILFSLVKRYFSFKQALITILLGATIPLMVIHSRIPYHTSLVFPASVFIVWITAVYRDHKYLPFILGLSLSLIYQIVLISFILVPIFIIALYWDKYKFSIKRMIMFLAGLFWGAIPLFIADFRRGYFIQTVGFIAWIGKNTIEAFHGLFVGTNATNHLGDIMFYTKLMYFPYSFILALLIFIFSLYIFIIVFKKLHRVNYIQNLIFTWMVIGLSAIFLRGIVSEAYLPLMFFPLVVAFGQLFVMILRYSKALGIVTLNLILASNIYFLLDSDYASTRYKSVYSEKLAVTSIVLNDAKGKGYNLIYRGKNYYDSSGDRYRYLLWWKGNEPSKNTVNTYIISDIGFIQSSKLKLVGNVGESYVYKD
jgi:hypothetical protein